MRLNKSAAVAVEIVAAGIGVAVVATMVGACQPSQSADVKVPASASARQAAKVQSQKAAPAQPAPKKTPMSYASTKSAQASKPVAASTPSETRAASGTAAKTSVVASTSTASVEQAEAVTITGCLERDNDTFRLKDTTGLDAPKARSWKSGFLKKGSASIEIVDAANRVKLPNHVGQRVSITGMLVEREMQVRSLQRVAASCKEKPVV
jgi:hypothetical protein